MTVQLPEPNDEDIAIIDNPQVELLHWHYWLNHFSFRVLKTLAISGLLSRRLVSAKEPKCTACIFGAMYKRPWCSHAQVSNIHPILNIT